MIKEIPRNIMTNIAQLTTWFNVSQQEITATTISNKIYNTGLTDGVYTISPKGTLDPRFDDDLDKAYDGSGTISTEPCICRTLEFTAGAADTDCYFGEVEFQHNLIANIVNVGTAMSKDLAIEIINDDKTDNCIIVYLISTENADRSDKRGLGLPSDSWVKYNIGVLVKLESDKLLEIGCTDADKLFISSILGVKTKTSTHLKFEKVLDRFTSGNYSVIEYLFSYEDFMLIYDIMKDRIRGFNNPNLHIKLEKE